MRRVASQLKSCRRVRRISFSLGIAACALLILGCDPEGRETGSEAGQQEERKGARVASQRDTSGYQRGAALYAGSCSSFCHGAAPREGSLSISGLEHTPQRSPDAPNLFDCAWLRRHSDSQIEEVIIAGIDGTRMVGFGTNFPDGQRDHQRLIGYLRTTADCETERPQEEGIVD